MPLPSPPPLYTTSSQHYVHQDVQHRDQLRIHDQVEHSKHNSATTDHPLHPRRPKLAPRVPLRLALTTPPRLPHPDPVSAFIGPDTSLGVRPFTLERVATLLAHLVHTQSPDGRAHIVGVSLGAHVAVALASLFPDVLQDRSMFVSGYNRFETPAMLRPIVPYFFYALMKGPTLLPKRLVRWAKDGADVTGVDARTGNEVTVEEREVEGVCNLNCKSRSFSDSFALGVLTRKRLRHSDVSCSALVWSLQAG
jgi:pimeloyl-ACP methyl ester carboxylesterase